MMGPYNGGERDKAFVRRLSNIAEDSSAVLARGGGAFLVTPGGAKLLADKGWTKKKVVSFITDELKHVPPVERPKETLYPAGHFEALMPTGEQALRIIVAGASADRVAAYQLSGGMAGWITKKVELPRNWDDLVKKYKDIIPTYARY
jgi:hypothetical protein